MKKILFPLFLLFAAVFVSCNKNDHDLSVLHGKWESKTFDTQVTPDDPVLLAAVKKTQDRFTMFRMVFGPGDEYREYRYMENRNDYVSMTSGNYFYNHGYKARYYDRTFSAEFDLRDGQLVCRLDLTKYYQDPSILGLEAQDSRRPDKVIVTILYEQAEFEIADR